MNFVEIRYRTYSHEKRLLSMNFNYKMPLSVINVFYPSCSLGGEEVTCITGIRA
jgi:hypothetical protein